MSNELLQLLDPQGQGLLTPLLDLLVPAPVALSGLAVSRCRPQRQCTRAPMLSNLDPSREDALVASTFLLRHHDYPS